ncbi:unnamed protein product [Effrenium voratum]|nr:unnamed protein product [Effrenium voratum]
MVIGPAWTRGEIEKPAGSKDMGTWTAAVYTPEQQARLGVDESGTKVTAGNSGQPPLPQSSRHWRLAWKFTASEARICGAVGPAWTRGEIEKPAGSKSMGTWTVYTPEQQARLGVDESGTKVTAGNSGQVPFFTASEARTCGAVGPAWTRGEIEKPAGSKSMGTWTANVYTPEQQARLGQIGSRHWRLAWKFTASEARICGAVGPAWTRGEIEKPAGSKSMGTWTAAAYTPEQQARLGVDESGAKVTAQRLGAVGPAWTRGEIEKPAGSKNMGTWTAKVYTDEQQARLGVDEMGQKVQAEAERPAKAAAAPAPAPAAAPITPQYAAALLQSEKLLADMCKKYFRKYDADKDGCLELEEIKTLCGDLHFSLGIELADVAAHGFEVYDKALEDSVKPYSESTGEAKLSEEDFPKWFSKVLEDNVKAQLAKEQPKQESEILLLKVKAVSGASTTVEVPASATVADFAEMASAALDLPSAKTKITTGGEVLSDSLKLADAKLDSGSELTAVVMNTIKVKRHVYNARGGAPPYRGYNLVASDEVELLAASPLKDEWDKLVPGDGYPGEATKFSPTVLAFQATPSAQVPRKWEGGMNEVPVSETSTAEETFGTDGEVELAILIPMRGFD